MSIIAVFGLKMKLMLRISFTDSLSVFLEAICDSNRDIHFAKALKILWSVSWHKDLVVGKRVIFADTFFSSKQEF